MTLRADDRTGLALVERSGACVEAAYGDSLPRLVEAKRRYDAENLWHVNKNIPSS
jgi:hypothetical protein